MSTTEHHEKATAAALCACGAAPDGYGLPTDAAQWRTWDQWLREHIADAERDERLRKARHRAFQARAVTYSDLNQAERAMLAFEDEVTRLGAVVTAVREVHRYRYLAGDAYPTCDGCGYIADDEDDPCPTRRALDGGAR